MKYLCLVYLEEKTLDDLTKSEFDALVCDSLDYEEVLRQRGHHVASAALERVQAATTLKVRNGKLSAADGPFAETKEQRGGFTLIEATDLNEAIQVASKIPPGRQGSIEVRPVLDPERPRQWAAADGPARPRGHDKGGR